MSDDEKIELPDVGEVKDDIGTVKRLWKKYKNIIIYLLATLFGGGGGAGGIYQFWIKPKVQEQIDVSIVENNVQRDSLHQMNSQSFRGGLAGEWGISKDEVVNYMVTKVDSLVGFMREAQQYRPFLERESEIVRIGYCIKLDTGEENWYGPDLQLHRLAWEAGRPWTIYHGHRKDLKGY